ncbi:hypothetical protein ACOSQ3_007274 [Xanthoceras sorbifolium]
MDILMYACWPCRFCDHHPLSMYYPEGNFWSKSVMPLCRFKFRLDRRSTNDTLEVDFANKYIGGDALHKGCVQVGLLFWLLTLSTKSLIVNTTATESFVVMEAEGKKLINI